MTKVSICTLLLLLPSESLGFGVQISSVPVPVSVSVSVSVPVLSSRPIQRTQQSLIVGKQSQRTFIPTSRCSSVSLFASKRNDEYEQELDIFAQYCDSDGFMTRDALTRVPMMVELLNDGDLLDTELEEFWNNIAKVPNQSEDKISVDSFLQLCQQINDLFVELPDEEQDNDDNNDNDTTVASLGTDQEQQQETKVNNEDMELQLIFRQLCETTATTETMLLSKEQLQTWDEIARLMDDGLLGEDELETLWEQTIQNSKSTNAINAEGFVYFNTLLDDLFIFDSDDEQDEDDDNNDDDDDDQLANETESLKSSTPTTLISGEDMPPSVLFSSLANEDYLVGLEELELWKELQTMLRDGDLLPQELQDLFTSNSVKMSNGGQYLTEDSFVSFFQAIDALFEEEEDEVSAEALEAKMALMEFLEELNVDTTGRLVCGLEANEREEEIVQNIVAALERNDAVNVIKKRGGDIQPADIVGDWKLLYSSSAAMKFNKGLSGIGGSFPNGKFGGLTQRLEYAKFRQDVVYKEQIDVIPKAASFQVEVNGAWELRKSISLFTNRPCTMLSVDPNEVKYGPTSTRGDHWKSLGPMNLLDVTYLDEDLRIMRGNTASDAIFVWQRIR